MVYLESDDQILTNMKLEAEERFQMAREAEYKGLKTSFDNLALLFQQKMNEPRKSLYQGEMEAVEKDLSSAASNSETQKKLIKKKELLEKKEQKRASKEPKIRDLFNLPKEEKLLSRFFAGSLTNKTTWLSRVGNYYVTQNYLCFKQQVGSFILAIPLFAIKNVVKKARSVSFEFNGQEYVTFERGLSKRLISLIEQLLEGYSPNSAQAPKEVEFRFQTKLKNSHKVDIPLALPAKDVGSRSPSPLVADSPEKQEKKGPEKSELGTYLFHLFLFKINFFKEEEEHSLTDSEDLNDMILEDSSQGTKFVPDQVLGTVIEREEMEVTAVKWFYILLKDDSNLFQDTLLFRGNFDIHISKWGKRDKEKGYWREIDYVSPIEIQGK